MAQARMKGKDISTTMKTGVLGTARGQQADASIGLSAASRMATSSLLGEARNKQAVRAAKGQAMAAVGGTFLGQMGENRADTGSYWMKPGTITTDEKSDQKKQSRGDPRNVFASIFGGGG
jgi:hypothetical protein